MKKIVSNKNLREFGIIIGIGFLLIIGCLLPLITNHPFRFWTLWVALPSLLFSYIKPDLLLYPYKLWIKLGEFLGWLNSKVILTFIFFLILFPISLFMRIFGYDPLRLKNSNKSSYRQKKMDYLIDFEKVF